MNEYRELQDVVMDPSFPELDLALRRGRHVDREDFAWYTLLVEGQDHLETFYRRYGCELVHKTDGYFYLLPVGDKLSRRQLSAGDMLVGQALALLYLDPATIERGGRITHEEVIAQLVVVLGSDALIGAFNPKRRRVDERIAQKTARARVAEAIRHLATLGFVDVLDDAQLRLRPSLLRFAEPVRGMSEPAEALAKLVATGEVGLVTDDETDADAADDDELDDDDDATDDASIITTEVSGPTDTAERELAATGGDAGKREPRQATSHGDADEREPKRAPAHRDEPAPHGDANAREPKSATAHGDAREPHGDANEREPKKEALARGDAREPHGDANEREPKRATVHGDAREPAPQGDGKLAATDDDRAPTTARPQDDGTPAASAGEREPKSGADERALKLTETGDADRTGEKATAVVAQELLDAQRTLFDAPPTAPAPRATSQGSLFTRVPDDDDLDDDDEDHVP